MRPCDVSGARPNPLAEHRGQLNADWPVMNARRNYRVATGCGSRAAKLFLRLLEIVRSMMAPQLMHFQA